MAHASDAALAQGATVTTQPVPGAGTAGSDIPFFPVTQPAPCCPSVTARREVEELVNEGMPSEEAPLEDTEKAERLLESIIALVTDEEAQMLATAFGPDGCYGLAWSSMHVIETAAGAGTASYLQDADNWWVQRLNARVVAGREIAETGHDAMCPDHMGGQGGRQKCCRRIGGSGIRALCEPFAVWDPGPWRARCKAACRLVGGR